MSSDELLDRAAGIICIIYNNENIVQMQNYQVIVHNDSNVYVNIATQVIKYI